MERGNGDPNVLGALAEDPTAADFGLIGAQRGGVPFFLPARTDVTGLLVGHRRLGDRFWFIFVAGAIKYRGSFTDFPLDEPKLVDLRAAAFSLRDGAFAWQVSEPDKEALRRYRDRQVELWCRNQPDLVDPAMAPTTFPTPADDWTLTIEDEGITIIDTHSGATLGTVPIFEKRDSPL